MKDGRTAIRLTGEVLNRVKRLAESTGRTYCAEIDVLLSEATGFIQPYPVIVKSGNEFIWLSPAGFYGKVNKQVYRRFMGGGLPISGERWDDTFATLSEAVLGLGTAVCKQATLGLMVEEPDLFTELHTQFK